jgi:hypothetical protein
MSNFLCRVNPDSCDYSKFKVLTVLKTNFIFGTSDFKNTAKLRKLRERLNDLDMTDLNYKAVNFASYLIIEKSFFFYMFVLLVSSLDSSNPTSLHEQGRKN